MIFEEDIKQKISELETIIKDAQEYIDLGIDITMPNGRVLTEYDWCCAGESDIYHGKLIALKDLIGITSKEE